jgi:hypothetical protein
VIGYVSAGNVQQDSIFINRPPNWPYIFECFFPDRSTVSNPDSLEEYFGAGLAVPTIEMGGRIFWNNVDCVDCRTLGGTTQEPSWWPN